MTICLQDMQIWSNNKYDNTDVIMIPEIIETLKDLKVFDAEKDEEIDRIFIRRTKRSLI